MSKKVEIQGEGDYKSSRRYNDALRSFLRAKPQRKRNPDVDEAARRQLERAEEAGTSRAKEEDPAVKREYSKPD